MHLKEDEVIVAWVEEVDSGNTGEYYCIFNKSLLNLRPRL